LPSLPSPLFAPHSVLLGYMVTTGSRNSKEGPRDLSDVTRNNTQHCVLRMSDSSVYKTEGSAAPVEYKSASLVRANTC
jgi:hypothetical protein